MRAVRLNFTGPVHIGQNGIGYESTSTIIHSDTLYSALWISWKRLFKEEGLNEDRSLPVLISSAYPFMKRGDNYSYFFPRPYIPAPEYDPEIMTEKGIVKSFKRVQYLRKDNFSKWIRREPLNFEDLISSEKELLNTIDVRSRPMVALDRVTNNSSLFYYGETRFMDSNQIKSGLYFLVKEDDRDSWEKLKEAISFMGDIGLGGKRSSGYGAFYPSFEENFELEEAEKGDLWTTISLVCPENRQNLSSTYRYEIINRIGWLGDNEPCTNRRHKKVSMFSEGSIFSSKIEGYIKDVRPEGLSHPVYRNGRSFMIRTSSDEENRL